MQWRVSTRIGLSVGALLLLTLVLQVVLTRMVMKQDVSDLRARASAGGLRLFALGMRGGPFDASTLDRTFTDGAFLGAYDARGVALARHRSAPARLAQSLLARADASDGMVWEGDDRRVNVLRLVPPAGEAHYLALGDGHIERHLRGSRLRILLMITLVSALLGLSASVWLTRVLRQKLLTARSTVRRVAEGDLSVRFAAGSDDELGELAHDFNRMTENLDRHIAARRDEAARRRRIFADWTHEIATPLTSVLGYLEALSAGGLDAERQRRYLSHAHGQAKDLERLVEDLTTLSQLESEGVRLNRVPTDVTRLVAAELDASALRAPHLHLERAPSEAIACAVDPTRLAQVLRNVLHNAERHARTRITVRCSKLGDEKACIQIADDGEGIAAEHLAHVTESFYRVDSSRARNTGGRGLGLAIARRLTEAHGGELTLSSELGVGTTVHITVSLSESHPRPR